MQLHAAKRFHVQQTNSDCNPVHDFYKMNLIKLFYTGFQVSSDSCSLEHAYALAST